VPNEGSIRPLPPGSGRTAKKENPETEKGKVKIETSFLLMGGEGEKGIHSKEGGMYQKSARVKTALKNFGGKNCFDGLLQRKNQKGKRIWIVSFVVCHNYWKESRSTKKKGGGRSRNTV